VEEERFTDAAELAVFRTRLAYGDIVARRATWHGESE